MEALLIGVIGGTGGFLLGFALGAMIGWTSAWRTAQWRYFWHKHPFDHGRRKTP